MIKVGLFFFLLLVAGKVFGDEGIIEISYEEAKLSLLSEKGEKIREFPVAVPQFKPKVSFKGYVSGIERNPFWIPTKGTREAYAKKFGRELPEMLRPGDPRNAMGIGKIKITFDDKKIDPTIRIHGTNDEKSIGQRISRGCIRLKNADITELMDLIQKKNILVKFSAT